MSRRRRSTFANRRGGSRARPSTVGRVPAQAGRRLRLSAPSDLVAIVPYLLGFPPTESLVIVFVASGRVRLTARLDLPSMESLDALADYVGALVQRQQPDSIVLLTYSDQVELARRLGEGITARLAPHEVTESLLVSGGRWWSLTCAKECCPREGTPYDAGSHPVAAEAVYAGMGIAPDRASLGSLVAGPPAGDLDHLLALTEESRRKLPPARAACERLIGRLVADHLREPHLLSDEECCRLAALAEDLTVRDVAWAAMTRERARDHVELWRQVVARTPPPLAPAPVCLLGMAAWIAGNGALTNFCIDRMLDLDPDYTMTTLLRGLAEGAAPPSLWDQLRSQLLVGSGRLAG